MRQLNRHALRLLIGAILLLPGTACRREGMAPGKEEGGYRLTILPEGAQTATKSVLTDADIETKISSVTIGVYSGGAIVAKAHYTSFADMSFSLTYDVSYTAYALVNMGDMTGALPSSESALPSLGYTIPAYTGSAASINTRGIPMAGSLSFVAGSAGDKIIPVKRLLAKVTASLSCDWSGARIRSARVYNMNAVLRPFGVSAAGGASDMLPFQELTEADGAGAASLTATFYVPENRQGTVSGISTSEQKAPDQNASVSALADRLTYLEVRVTSTGRYDGEITYRSYLGGNATTSFDLQRNYRYAWTIHYRSERVDDFSSDWKHVLGLTVSDYSLSLSPHPKTIAVGGSFTYTPTLTQTILYPSASTSSSVLSGGSLNWSSDNTSVATVSADGTVTGVAQGTAHITAGYTPPGADFSERTASATVHVNALSYELEVTPSSASGTYLSPVSFHATYYTLTNGIRDSGVDVTSAATWSCTGGPAYSVHEGVVSVHPTSSAPMIAGETAVTATYGGGSATALALFSDVPTYTIEVCKEDDTLADGLKLVVGGSKTLKARYTHFVNGFLVGASFVSASWTSSAPAVAGITSGGVVSGLQTGGATLTATYSGTSGTADVTVIAWDDGWDDDPEIEL